MVFHRFRKEKTNWHNILKSKISQQSIFSLPFLNGKYRAKIWSRTHFVVTFKCCIGTSLTKIVWKQSLNVFWKKKKTAWKQAVWCENAKMTERVNVTSYFKILGTWIKIKINKELTWLAKYEGSSVYRVRVR